MKFTPILSLAILAGSVMAQANYDVLDFATRDIDQSYLSARELRADLVLRALQLVKRQAEDHADLLARAFDSLDNVLYRRWGSGKYTIDDHTYHLQVKPLILQEMNKIKGFSSKCGHNPDFFVERDGTVYPSSRTDKKGLCTKKVFAVNMHSTLLSFVHRSPSPEPSRSRSHSPRELEEFDDLD